MASVHYDASSWGSDCNLRGSMLMDGRGCVQEAWKKHDVHRPADQSIPYYKSTRAVVDNLMQILILI